MLLPLAEMAERAATRRRAAILPPIFTTAAQEAALFRLYVRILRIWHQGVQRMILPAYALTLRQESMARDSVADIDVALGVVEQTAVAAQISFPNDVGRWAATVEAWHRERLVSSIKYATNVNLDTMLGSDSARATLEGAIARNVALVRSVSDQVRNSIANIVFQGLTARTPIRDLARQITAATGIARARALRIASDQTVKISTQLDEERHRQLGIKQFRWRHSGKVHFRPEHRARNGKVFAWNGAVGRGDPPGRLPFCGCKAQAVVGKMAPEQQAAVEAAPAPVPVAVPAKKFAYESFVPFKTAEQGATWMRENIANTVKLTKGAKVDGLSDLAHATLEVNERFAMPKIRFMGDPQQDTLVKWKSLGRATAAYGRASDGFLFRNQATSRKAVEAAFAPGQTQAYGALQLKAAQDYSFVHIKSVDVEVHKRLPKMTALNWSVSPTSRATAYHEMGHRFHGFNVKEVDAVLGTMPPGNGWHYLMSRYAATNGNELVAESFALYMQGDESQFFRIYPPLLKLFKSKDALAQ